MVEQLSRFLTQESWEKRLGLAVLGRMKSSDVATDELLLQLVLKAKQLLTDIDSDYM